MGEGEGLLAHCLRQKIRSPRELFSSKIRYVKLKDKKAQEDIRIIDLGGSTVGIPPGYSASSWSEQKKNYTLTYLPTGA